MKEKWEPSDILRLVALIGALVLFTIGALMMWQGISAEGAIDIKSSVISGSLQTGSAGLFIVFLSFIIIVFVLTTLVMRKPAISVAETPQKPSKSKALAKGFFILLAVVVVSASLAALGFGEGFGLLATGFGMLALGCGIALLGEIETE